MSSKGKVVVLSGPSGVGKGTVHHVLLDQYRNYELSVSVTTRAPRQGEQEGVHYYYRTVPQYQQLVQENAFVEHACRYSNYYGTLHSELDRITAKDHHVILDIEYTGALNIKRAMPDAVLIFLLPPSLEELHRRIVGRGSETPESLEIRYTAAVSEMQKYAEHYDYILINDDAEACAKRVDEIVRCEQRITRDNLYLIDQLIGGNKIC